MKYLVFLLRIILTLTLSGCMSSWGFQHDGPFNGFDYNEFADGSCNGTGAQEITIKLEKLKANAKCYREQENVIRVLNP